MSHPDPIPDPTTAWDSPVRPAPQAAVEALLDSTRPRDPFAVGNVVRLKVPAKWSDAHRRDMRLVLLARGDLKTLAALDRLDPVAHARAVRRLWNEWPGYPAGVVVEIVARGRSGRASHVALFLFDPETGLVLMRRGDTPGYNSPEYVDYSVDELDPWIESTEPEFVPARERALSSGTPKRSTT